MRLIELGAGSWPAAFGGIVLCRLMDVVGVPQHTIAAQEIPTARSSSSGLHGKVVLHHEHFGCGEGLGECFFG
jgi:hypothetical protein